MQFYQELETILQISVPKRKIEQFLEFYEDYKTIQPSVAPTEFKPLEFKEPAYSSYIKVVSPRDVPKRTNLATTTGQIHLLHAVAHIEYSAIDLALDICYRFRGMPREFYDDWLEVADDEVRHFRMIESLLQGIGGEYGELSVHNALFEASQKTAHSLLDRLAVVPRYLEANGLDATPAILKKLTHLQNSKTINDIADALGVILQEEILHVQKGDKWFRYCCAKDGYSHNIYIEIINHYYPQGFKKLKTLNVAARQEAGFSCSELKSMVQKNVCED